MLTPIARGLTLLALLGSLALAGCGSVGKLLASDTSGPAPEPAAATTTPTAAVAVDAAPPARAERAPDEVTPTAAPDEATTAVADASAAADQQSEVAEMEEYDPWEGFNQKTFEFNRKLDRWVLKPVATAYDKVMPEPWQLLISHAFENLKFPVRFVNNLLQQKWSGAGRELGRFLINSTAGIGGVFDPAKDYWGIDASPADFGQTLGKWGVHPGPYLILPLLPPMTVRDGIGSGVDGVTSPLAFYGGPFIWNGLGLRAGGIVNDRAMNLDVYQGIEETVVDMYAAVRNFYLRKREQKVRE